MNRIDVLVIGGGPAGVSAAVTLAESGFSVTLAEQRPCLGGAIHRPFMGSGTSPLRLSSHHRRTWQGLEKRLAAVGERVRVRHESVFLGVDGDARFLLDDRRENRVVGLFPKAVVVAVGAIERVTPRPGWELPGVVTAGGMQLQLKETGQVPEGPILIAGTGPLPLALGAQLAAAGNPPVAILERGQPWHAAFSHPSAALGGLRSPAYMGEALGYAVSLARSGVPYKTGWCVTEIEAVEGGLRVVCRHASGKLVEHRVRHLALHDGLACNDHGLPPERIGGVSIVRAGDCREVLGADAALWDGCRAAQSVAREFGQSGGDVQGSAFERKLASARRMQQTMQLLCASPPIPIAQETIVCRCEGLRRRDLEALQGAASLREIRLVGRFGMGLCQGRFCLPSVRVISSEAGNSQVSSDFAGVGQGVPRWPLRPVSVASLAGLHDV